VVSLFQRLEKGRPPAAEEKVKPRNDDLEQAQRLLNFLQKWGQKTITERQIRIYGPGVLRNRKSVNQATEILIKNGWLRCPQTTPRGGREWEIIHKAVVAPRVAARTLVAGALAEGVAE
jgi:hypothetical protein